MNRLYVDLPEVANLLSLSTATIQKLVRQNEFPPPRKLSAQRVGWLVREVQTWAEERPISDLPPPPNTGHRKGMKFDSST
ncbi:helix-turn-helix transcriptional regulator [Pseudoduganella sp. R-43]|uniref:helix-turn-helix transcriptional regulator n=1 Tax=Pseudoduganella sp. R-43 TaxID=3404063 RepID=UPI003CEAFA95